MESQMRPPDWSDFLKDKLLAGYMKAAPEESLPRDPIPPHIMNGILLYKVPEFFMRVMVKAALSLAYYGCLRVADYTRHLCLEGVETMEDSKAMKVTVRETKTSKKKPVTLVVKGIPKNRALCPVVAMEEFLRLRDRFVTQEHLRQPYSPLFVHYQDEAPLTRVWITGHVRRTARELGMGEEEARRLMSHSVRIGAATVVGLQPEVTPATIQGLGRWKSKAYKTYVRKPGVAQSVTAQRLLQRVTLRAGVATATTMRQLVAAGTRKRKRSKSESVKAEHA